MTRPSHRAKAFFVAVLAVSAPAFARNDSDPDDKIAVKDVRPLTDKQFERLVAKAGGDQKKAAAINWTRDLFNQYLIDTNRVPADSKFDQGAIDRVGKHVSKIFDLVQDHEQRLSAATSQAQVVAEN